MGQRFENGSNETDFCDQNLRKMKMAKVRELAALAVLLGGLPGLGASAVPLRSAGACHGCAVVRTRPSRPRQSAAMDGGAGRGPASLLSFVLRSPGVSLTASSVLLTVLVCNRFVLDEVANSQSRSDLLATGAAAALVLHALASLDIESRIADRQQLIGTQVPCEVSAAGLGSEELEPLLRWLGESILACTPTASLLVYDRARGRTLLRYGIMGPAAEVQPGPILDKCLTDDRARGTYLASLQNYPGRFELSYLPPNTQCVLVQPYGDGAGAIILGADTARAYTNKHLTWVQLLADRLGSELGLSTPAAA
jgi:hypothetical protein